eukprot:479055-Amphidinium_carterae.2
MRSLAVVETAPSFFAATPRKSECPPQLMSNVQTCTVFDLTTAMMYCTRCWRLPLNFSVALSYFPVTAFA